MKRSIALGLVLGILFSVSACKKKKNKTNDSPEPEVGTPAPAQYPSYSQLKTGNYWIYQNFDVSSAGANPLNEFDSCYVEKDTTIGKYTYSKIRRKSYISGLPDYVLQRDSLHYMVSPGGGVLFSSEDFTSSFGTFYGIDSNGDTTSRAMRKMADKDKQIITPAGVFTTRSMRTTVSGWPASSGNTKYLDTRYAKQAGLITEVVLYFSGGDRTVERRLVRYHLE